jgi:hypothetical protein
VFHSAKTFDSSSRQIAADAAIWSFVIIRCRRDQEILSENLAAGDPFTRRIIQRIGDWLMKQRRRSAAQASLCMICERGFKRSKSPDVFCIGSTDDPRAKRNTVLAAVCRCCAATHSDVELLTRAARDTDTAVLGFGMVGPSPSMH